LIENYLVEQFLLHCLKNNEDWLVRAGEANSHFFISEYSIIVYGGIELVISPV
jgi:hypothetical protein